MIFKQYREVLRGAKKQTRRIVKPNEAFFDGGLMGLSYVMANNRVKWRVGNHYAAVPKYQHPAWWFFRRAGEVVCIENPRDYLATQGDDMALESNARITRYLRETGAVRVDIVIEMLYTERLQSITDTDAQKEGVTNIEAYERLWESINTRKGTRWQDNPLVWVIGFHVDHKASDLYQAWRTQQAKEEESA